VGNELEVKKHVK